MFSNESTHTRSRQSCIYARHSERAEGALAISEEWERGERTVVCGSPDDCIARIEEYLKAGVKHLLFEMISPSVTWDRIKIFGEKVLPYFRGR